MKRHLLALAVLTTACASAPRNSEYDGVREDAITREARLCLAVSPCTVVQIQNNNFYDAVIYLNGAKIGEVIGNHARPIFIRDSQLRDGRCATVVVRLIGPGTVQGTTKECVPVGGHYQLTIENTSGFMPLHLWLVPRD